MRTPRTDFEKLLFAHNYIKILKKQVKDLEYKVYCLSYLENEKEVNIESNKFKKYNRNLIKQNKDLIKKNKQQKDNINQLQIAINKLKKEKV
jgi:hypothetical protein